MRLIDADKLKDIKRRYHFREQYDANLFDHIINQQPTIDAVEVVRCKDCKHRDPEDLKCDCGHAILWQLCREDDWYCADGEKK